MKYPSDREWHDAQRAEYLRAAIQRDEMVLNDLTRYEVTDWQVKHAIRLAKRRIARNTKQLER